MDDWMEAGTNAVRRALESIGYAQDPAISAARNMQGWQDPAVGSFQALQGGMDPGAMAARALQGGTDPGAMAARALQGMTDPGVMASRSLSSMGMPDPATLAMQRINSDFYYGLAGITPPGMGPAPGTMTGDPRNLSPGNVPPPNPNAPKQHPMMGGPQPPANDPRYLSGGATPGNLDQAIANLNAGRDPNAPPPQQRPKPKPKSGKRQV
jgi:hypothetical protein